MTRALAVIFAFALTACAGAPVAHGTPKDRTERRMARWVDSHTNDEIAFLERVVNVNSGTMNLEGVRKVGAIYRKAFDDLGMTTEWVELPEPMNRAGHLVARTRAKGPGVLLIGHLDTVFEKDSPFQRFERDGHMAKGPGVIDMKGGNTVILFALRALAHAGVLHELPITVVFTGDEEKPGAPLATTRAVLVSEAKRSKAALGFESLVNSLDTATIARRGFTGWTLEVTGKRGHSSLVFGTEYGFGAIYEAARILDGFRSQFAGAPNLTVSTGRVLGGTAVTDDASRDGGTVMGKRNVIPQTAIAAGDIRALTEQQLQATMTTMRKLVAESLPHTSAELTFEEGYPPMAPTEGNRKLLAELDRINRDLGRGPITAVPPMQRGAADVSFVAPIVPTMDGLGLHGAGDHSPAEVVDLRSVPIATKRAALLIYRLARR